MSPRTTSTPAVLAVVAVVVAVLRCSATTAAPAAATTAAMRPALVLITWTDEGAVVGVDPQGGVHVSEDRGGNWQERGSAGGQPAALAAAGDEVFVATGDGRILQSADGGRSFTVRYREP